MDVVANREVLADLVAVAQAADNMGVNRLAFLTVLMTRILAEVPPEIKLPGAQDGAIGARASLNLGVMLVALSGRVRLREGALRSTEEILTRAAQ